MIKHIAGSHSASYRPVLSPWIEGIYANRQTLKDWKRRGRKGRRVLVSG